MTPTPLRLGRVLNILVSMHIPGKDIPIELSVRWKREVRLTFTNLLSGRGIIPIPGGFTDWLKGKLSTCRLFTGGKTPPSTCQLEKGDYSIPIIPPKACLAGGKKTENTD